MQTKSEMINRIAELAKENAELKAENKILLGQLVINDGEDVTVQISKSQFDEYNQFKDMAKKGLGEFKDVGGCWGCGLQLQLNQDMEDIKQLKAENERLKKELKNNKSEYQLELNTYNIECGNLLEENKELAHYLACMTEQRNKANTCLQEIKGAVTALYMNNWLQMNETARKSIQLLQELITKAEEE